ncbi:MAG: hypothetical protein J7L19_05895 [Dehalococcoidia bacterium]|nr:hypothetical protein [Dehalococcoidia bacterium]
MKTEIFEYLREAVVEYDTEGAANWAKKAVEEKINPVKALDVLTQAIRRRKGSLHEDFGIRGLAVMNNIHLIWCHFKNWVGVCLSSCFGVLFPQAISGLYLALDDSVNNET